MEIEVWSDVMCPFCYIGKRRLEHALAHFPHKDQVQVRFRSFMLNPDLKTDPSLNVVAYLAKIKGWSMDYSRQMHAQVTAMAKEVGLVYDFDNAVVANSLDAHRVMQLGRTDGLSNAVCERIFKAYFTEGKNIADHETLAQLAGEVGMDADRVRTELTGNGGLAEVKADLDLAQGFEIYAVPFFLFDRKLAISGAQQLHVFEKTLAQAWEKRG